MKMKNLYKKRFLSKLIILTVLLLAPITSSAEVGDKKWTKECAKDNKKKCAASIIHQVNVPDSDKKQTLISVYIQIATTTERKMDLVDGEEKTYKLKEKNKLVPFLIIKYPLNVDLQKSPLVQIDKKNVLNNPYTHCNMKDGCMTSTGIKEEMIKRLKTGKELTVISAIYGSKQNLLINLPLKGFTKAYDSLLK